MDVSLISSEIQSFKFWHKNAKKHKNLEMGRSRTIRSKEPARISERSEPVQENKKSRLTAPNRWIRILDIYRPFSTREYIPSAAERWKLLSLKEMGRCDIAKQ